MPPNGDSHDFPDLPLPAVCFSAITTLPFPIPFLDRNLAIVFVEPTSLKTYRFFPTYFVFKPFEISEDFMYSFSVLPMPSIKSAKSLMFASLISSEIMPSLFNKLRISFFI